MEATIRNFTMPAVKVHASLTFCVRLDIRIGATAMDTSTAKRGFIEVMTAEVSMVLLEAVAKLLRLELLR